MKKLEKLGSKLFEEFRGDEVSELASVIGGVCYETMIGTTPDKWVQDTDWNKDGRSNAFDDTKTECPEEVTHLAHFDPFFDPSTGHTYHYQPGIQGIESV